MSVEEPKCPIHGLTIDSPIIRHYKGNSYHVGRCEKCKNPKWIRIK